MFIKNRITTALTLGVIFTSFLVDTASSSNTQNLRGRALGKKKAPPPPPPPKAPAAPAAAAPPVSRSDSPRPISIRPKDTAEQKTLSSLTWTSEGGAIRLNGEPFHAKGVAWFGMEDDGFTPHGLDKIDTKTAFDFLKQNGFNALRLPFSLEMALHPNEPIEGYDHLRGLKDEDLHELTRIELLSKMVDKAGEEGFVVMLDMHRLSLWDQGELWYTPDGKYTVDDFYLGWSNILTAVGDRWNIVGLDLKNEPRGTANWGPGDAATDWGLAAANVSQLIFQNFPEFKGLAFVQGVENPTGTWLTSNGRWWGGDLGGVRKFPIDLRDPGFNKRVAYAPHIYGPSIYMMDYFKDPDFPNNLPDVFQEQWGFAQVQTGRAVVLGEWGGSISSNPLMKQWADALVDYMVKRCMTSNFWWSLNPDSSDTGGLLEADWATPDMVKLDMLAKLQPHPSRLALKAGAAPPQYLFTPGDFASTECSLKDRFPTPLYLNVAPAPEAATAQP